MIQIDNIKQKKGVNLKEFFAKRKAKQEAQVNEVVSPQKTPPKETTPFPANVRTKVPLQEKERKTRVIKIGGKKLPDTNFKEKSLFRFVDERAVDDSGNSLLLLDGRLYQGRTESRNSRKSLHRKLVLVRTYSQTGKTSSAFGRRLTFVVIGGFTAT